ncbi:MAG TPA: hypothetical protein VML58_00500 [Burkholderiaceae bacterium]|nr:hypothetical protein [Burkholderiaceae bacterium]
MRVSAVVLRVASIVVPALAAQGSALAQPSGDEMNASNNPLTPSVAFNVQDAYTARYYDLGDKASNALLLRGALPHKLFGMPQLARLTLPVVTTADLPPVGRKTGFGDLNVFDTFIVKSGGVEYGLGPQLTIPTASRDEMGTGKWQAGLAALAIAPQKWGLIGGLLTWQHSFAGDGDRPTQNNAQLQPFFIANLPHGVYLRSTAVWQFDFARDTHYIPIGAGAGYVWKAGSTTLNAFVEPQWTVSHDGANLPQFQVFMGLNLQFPLQP